MITLYQGDCIEEMKKISDKSVNLILTDPPYQITDCSWDAIIPFDKMWEQLNRIIQNNRVIILFGIEPFSSTLRMSNIKNYKYDWVWNKKFAGNFVNARLTPLKIHENILVFCNGKSTYYPQMINRINPIRKGGNKQSEAIKIQQTKTSEKFAKTKKIYTQKFPESIVKFNGRNERGFHPTQKPVALMEYLIKTYTKEKELVLDFTMGSGTTGVACKKLNRNFIGIEKDKKYFQIAKKRIKSAQKGLIC